MELHVLGHPAYCYTGGRPFDAAKPTAVFVHGVLNDHSVWALQSRWLAHHGWNVLAVDLPGHGRSGGATPASVEDAAAWVLALLDAAGAGRAALVGHSWGSLIALHAASLAPQRVSHLALVGTAAPMRVSPALLQQSQDAPHAAIDLVVRFSHALLAPPPSALGPGTWLPGQARALMRRLHAKNPASFHTGFAACDRYAGAEAAMATVATAGIPTRFILGRHDAMTPPRAARALQAAAPHAETVLLEAGHSLMTEAPEGTLAALRSLLRV